MHGSKNKEKVKCEIEIDDVITEQWLKDLFSDGLRDFFEGELIVSNSVNWELREKLIEI